MTVKDALFSIPSVTGSVVLVPDCDGDGLADLAVARGGEWHWPERVDFVSSRNGALIRTLRKIHRVDTENEGWTAGGDLDGDHYPDLVLADSNADDGIGRVWLISGKLGSPIAEIRGSCPQERLGAAVAFVGDVNGDGFDDFAVGAGQYDPARLPPAREIASFQSESGMDGEKRWVIYSDGTRVTEAEHAEMYMRARSDLPGFVSLRSGKDRSELWRVSGKTPGHEFGSHLFAVGDLDQDGKIDLLVQSDLRATDPLVLLSGADGKELARMPHKQGLAGPAGDLDGDKVPDLFLDNEAVSAAGRAGKVTFVSGKTRANLFTLPYPDFLSNYGVTVAMGDLDGDGVGDIALGDGNFNLVGPGNPGYQPGHDVDLSRLSLDDAMHLESNPWCAFTYESGCAIIYSGRTRKPIFGVWAEPGSRAGLGVAVSRMPDLTGDGLPEVLVANGSTAYVFRGPGREPK